jgi:hypothetical protein
MAGAAGYVYATFEVGYAGTPAVYRRDPGSSIWTNIAPAGVVVTAVREYRGALYAVTNVGTVLRHNPEDGMWTSIYALPGEPAKPLRGMWSNEDYLYVGGLNIVLRFDGKGWLQLDGLEYASVDAVAGSDGDLVILERDGALQRGPGDYGWIEPARLYAAVANPGSPDPRDALEELAGDQQHLSASWRDPITDAEFITGHGAIYQSIAGHAFQVSAAIPQKQLRGIWGRRSGPESENLEIYAVGGATFLGVAESAVYHYDGQDWAEVPAVPGSGIPQTAFSDVTGTADDIFVGGHNGTISRFDGQDWHALNLADPLFVRAVVIARDTLYVLTLDLEIDTLENRLFQLPKAQWDSGTPEWEQVGISTSDNALFSGMWATPEGEVLLFGQSIATSGKGCLLRLSGASADCERLPSTGLPVSVSGTASNDIFVLTGQPTSELMHYDGTAWSRIRMNLSTIYNHVHATATTVRLVGNNGAATMLLRR